MRTVTQGYSNQFQQQLFRQYQYNARREYDGAMGGLDYLLGSPEKMVAANDGRYSHSTYYRLHLHDWSNV